MLFEEGGEWGERKIQDGAFRAAFEQTEEIVSGPGGCAAIYFFVPLELQFTVYHLVLGFVSLGSFVHMGFLLIFAPWMRIFNVCTWREGPEGPFCSHNHPPQL